MASTNNETLADAHRIDRELLDRIHELELERLQLRRVPEDVLCDDECIRHDIPIANGERHIIEFKYLESQFHVMGGIFPSMNSVTGMHYKMVRPDRVHQNNAWAECEVKRDGVWVSMENLPLLSIAN